MATSFKHPGSLNPWQQYRQACSIFSHTSRANNPAWFQSALDLDLQLHIRPDGPLVFSSYLNRKTGEWTPGPPLTTETLCNQEHFESLATAVLKHAREQGTTSAGVIIHIADEFATAELKPEFDNPADLTDLRDTAVHDPIAILEDSSISPEQATWRVLPYLATGSEIIGTTITATRRFDPLLSALREAGEKANFPLITRAMSAPLVALMGLPSILKHQPQKPFVTILQYPWFTVLAFFNEHADLRLVRTLQHRGIRRAANFRNALFTTSASLEFLDPDLYIIPLGQDIDQSLETTLIANFAHTRVEVLDVPTTPGVPKWCPEPVISTTPANPDALLKSITITNLRDDGWSTQDFLPVAKELGEIYPSQSEMKILRFARLIRVGVAVLALAGLAFFGMSILDLMRKPEWSFEPSQAQIEKAHLAQLNLERQRIDHWNNLLADRSKTWVNMESIAQMFPQDGGMLVKGVSYTAKPQSAPDRKNQRTTTIGFIKTWRISGFAREQALDYLNSLNTRDGINAHFAKVAAITGSVAYDMSLDTRQATINIRTLENNGFRPVPISDSSLTDESTYPFTFDMTITQEFFTADPLAITMPKAP